MLTVVRSPQEEELEVGDCQEADMEGGESSRNSGSVGGLCVCGESRKSSTADRSRESSRPCSRSSGHAFSGGQPSELLLVFSLL